MSLIKDIKDHLVNEGITYTIKLSTLPNNPDTLIVLYEYAGRPSDHLNGISRPGLQIRARAKDYETARQALQDIENILNKVGDDHNGHDSVLINGTLYLRIRSAQGVNPLGEDKQERIEITQNYQVDRRMN